MVGRQKPYKNHDVVFAAWEAHTAGPFWRGDELVLLGDGAIPGRCRIMHAGSGVHIYTGR